MARFLYIFVSFLAITLYMNSRVVADDSDTSKTDCYSQIDKKLQKNDLIDVIRTNGETVTGMLKEVKFDKLILKSKTKFFYQPAAIYKIPLDSITTVRFDGIRKNKLPFNKANMAIIGGAVGLALRENNGFNPFHDERGEKGSISKYTLTGMAVGFVLGWIIESTGKSLPVNIGFNCNN